MLCDESLDDAQEFVLLGTGEFGKHLEDTFVEAGFRFAVLRRVVIGSMCLAECGGRITVGRLEGMCQ
ncbi:unnamed protein product [uncultured bacterium]|nr:unnamed protein product [uncultured bacterium]